MQMMMIMMGGGWSSREAEREIAERRGKAEERGEAERLFLFSREGERERRRENKRNKLIRWRKGVSGGKENYCT